MCSILFCKYRYLVVPQSAETQGQSDENIGKWVTKRKIFDDSVVIATKCIANCEMT
ncbi:hypothetical protein V6Z11_A08G053100 [Gossypium hirsutum]